LAKRYSPLAVRGILYGDETAREVLVAQGRQALEEELYGAALQFFCEAEDADGLVEMKRLSLDLGDAFILRAVAETSPELVQEDDWKQLIAKAQQLGKDSMVDFANRYLHGDEPAEELPPGAEPDKEV